MNTMKRGLLAALAACAAAGFLCPSTSHAEGERPALPGLFGLSIDELGNVEVVTASRKPEALDHAPNVMYIITATEIRRRGYTTLRHVLESVPGFAVFHRDLQYVAQVRGIAPNDNEKITVMINGHSINQVWEPEVLGGAIPLDNLDRIEIIVGPGSVLYGADTLAAIVNLITRQQDHDEVTLHVGSRSTYGVTAVAGRDLGQNRNLTVSASYRRNDGFDAWLPDASNERNRNLAGTKLTGELYPSVTLLGCARADNWMFQFFALNSQMPELHLHGNGIADDGRRYDYINSAVIRNVYPWTKNVETSFELFGDYKRILRSIVEVGSGTGAFPNWDTTQTSYGMEEALRIRTQRHYFQAGIQIQVKQHRHNYDFQWNPDDPSATSEMRSIVEQADTGSLGAYISEEFILTPQWKVIGAIRADHDSILDSSQVYASPRAALIYTPSATWTLRLMHNSAARMPTPIMSPRNELWGEGNAFAPDWANSNPPASEPERLSTTEFQAIHCFHGMRVALNLYYQELKDFISWYSPFTNVGDFDGFGGELAVRSHVSRRCSLWFSGAYSGNDFETRGQMTESAVGSQRFQLPANDRGEVVAAPRYTANLGAEWELLHDVFLCPVVRYFTRQPMFRGEGWTYADNRVYVDATLTWEDAFAKDVDIRLTGRNLLNDRAPVGTQWMADAYRPEGTTVEIAMTVRF